MAGRPSTTTATAAAESRLDLACLPARQRWRWHNTLHTAPLAAQLTAWSLFLFACIASVEKNYSHRVDTEVQKSRNCMVCVHLPIHKDPKQLRETHTVKRAQVFSYRKGKPRRSRSKLQRMNSVGVSGTFRSSFGSFSQKICNAPFAIIILRRVISGFKTPHCSARVCRVFD